MESLICAISRYTPAVHQVVSYDHINPQMYNQFIPSYMEMFSSIHEVR